MIREGGNVTSSHNSSKIEDRERNYSRRAIRETSRKKNTLFFVLLGSPLFYAVQKTSGANNNNNSTPPTAYFHYSLITKTVFLPSFSSFLLGAPTGKLLLDQTRYDVIPT